MLKRIIKWCIPLGIYNIYTKNLTKWQKVLPPPPHFFKNENSVNYSDYNILKILQNIDCSRICELVILKKLCELGFDIENISKKYSFDEHKNIWLEIINCLKENKNNSEFFKCLSEVIQQFSPYYNSNNLDYISTSSKTVLELLEIVSNTEKLNIIELGSNHGIIAKILQLLGHNVLCSDLHHGIISNSINTYKVGTWIRENFIGVNAVDTFKFNEDNIDNLRIFDNGIDVIVIRGTGILNLGKGVIDNIINLVKMLNKNGVLFAKDENIFSEYDMGKRKILFDKLSERTIDICSINYKIEKKYRPLGWEKFDADIICKKK